MKVPIVCSVVQSIRRSAPAVWLLALLLMAGRPFRPRVRRRRAATNFARPQEAHQKIADVADARGQAPWRTEGEGGTS
jgi:hypothetical protein